MTILKGSLGPPSVPLSPSQEQPNVNPDTRDEILISLGEIKGQLAGFIASQAAQDRRMDGHEDRMDSHSDNDHTTPT